MANNYLLKCILCDHEFVVTPDVMYVHCPNCDLNKNIVGCCAVIEKDIGAMDELIVNMINSGFAKTVSFGN